MDYFGTAWATCMISKCCHYKMAGLNLSTHHEVGDWASICHPFEIPWCQPWRFNGPFWNSVWLLVWFPSAATIKWLAWTFQPTIKLVIEPASAILLYSWILLPMPPNASPGLSMGYFGTAWATCMISKCCHYKMAGLNLSTHHEVGDWASICHPFAFLDASPGVSMGHFGIVFGYLYDFQVLPL